MDINVSELSLFDAFLFLSNDKIKNVQRERETERESDSSSFSISEVSISIYEPFPGQIARPR